MKEAKFLITFVIPAFGRQHLLEETLRSIRNQTSSRWQVLVIDDGSFPKILLPNWTKQYPIRLRRLRKNTGPSAARNLGLRLARTPFICFLDSDDLLERKFITNMVRCAIKHASAVLCLSSTISDPSYPKSKQILQSFINVNRNLVLRYTARTKKKLIPESFFAATLSRTVFPTQVIKHYLFNEDLTNCEDWELILRYLRKHTITILPEKLVRFRFTPGSFSEVGRTQTKWKKYHEVLSLLPESHHNHFLIRLFKWYIAMFSQTKDSSVMKKNQTKTTATFASAHEWSTHHDNKLGTSKFAISHLSKIVRHDQFLRLMKLIQPAKKTTILDVGTTPNETLPDSNYFEQVYPYPKSVHIASVENCKKLVNRYGLDGFTLVKPNRPLPFKTKSYAVATAWATLEHVGGLKQQQEFLEELSRVGKKVFVTTPYKYCIFEPHTQMLFLHWMPNTWYRAFLRWRGASFWAKEENWNALGIGDVKKIAPNSCSVELYYMFGCLPSHILIYTTPKDTDNA